MIRTLAALLLSLVASPAIGRAAEALSESGIERIASRAETMRSAVAIHDAASRQTCALPPGDALSSGDVQCDAGTSGAYSLLHPYWTALLFASVCLCALAAAGLTFTAHRTSTGYRALVCFLAALTILQAASAAIGARRSVQQEHLRSTRAELRWQLDIARASSLEDRAAGQAALDAAQRYAVAVTRS